MDWYSLNLGDAMLAFAPLARLTDIVVSTYEGASSSDDMAAFIRHESEGRLHCEVMIYLPPSLAAVAKQVGATPCEKPSADGLGLLAGSANAWQALFPEHASQCPD